MFDTAFSANFVSNLTDRFGTHGVLFLVGAISAAILVIFAKQIGSALSVIDYPAEPAADEFLSHKRHAAPVPAVGGIILIISCTLVTTLSIYLNPPPSGQTDHYAIIALAILGTMVLGFFDDRKHIPALRRLLVCGLIFTMMILALPQIIMHSLPVAIFGMHIPLGILAIPFTLACIIGFQNAVNMADGRNGLVLGLAIFWTLHLQAHVPNYLLPLLGGVFASIFVVFIANVRGQLFLGDCGSYGIATLFSIIALYLYTGDDGSFRRLEAPGIVLTFLLPCLDMFRLIFERMKGGRSPFAADDNHLHHLLDRSVGWSRGWWVYMALAMAPAIIYHNTQRFPALTIGLAVTAYALVVYSARRRITERAS